MVVKHYCVGFDFYYIRRYLVQSMRRALIRKKNQILQMSKPKNTILHMLLLQVVLVYYVSPCLFLLEIYHVLSILSKQARAANMVPHYQRHISKVPGVMMQH